MDSEGPAAGTSGPAGTCLARSARCARIVWPDGPPAARFPAPSASCRSGYLLHPIPLECLAERFPLPATPEHLPQAPIWRGLCEKGAKMVVLRRKLLSFIITISTTTPTACGDCYFCGKYNPCSTGTANWWFGVEEFVWIVSADHWGDSQSLCAMASFLGGWDRCWLAVTWLTQQLIQVLQLQCVRQKPSVSCGFFVSGVDVNHAM